MLEKFRKPLMQVTMLSVKPMPQKTMQVSKPSEMWEAPRTKAKR